MNQPLAFDVRGTHNLPYRISYIRYARIQVIHHIFVRRNVTACYGTVSCMCMQKKC